MTLTTKEAEGDDIVEHARQIVAAAARVPLLISVYVNCTCGGYQERVSDRQTDTRADGQTTHTHTGIQYLYHDKTDGHMYPIRQTDIRADRQRDTHNIHTTIRQETETHTIYTTITHTIYILP